MTGVNSNIKNNMDDLSWLKEIVIIDPLDKNQPLRTPYPKESWCVGHDDGKFVIYHLFTLKHYNDYKDGRMGGSTNKNNNGYFYFSNVNRYHIFACPTEEIAKKLLAAINTIPGGDYKNIMWNIMEANNKIKEMKQLIIDLNKANTIITKLFTNPK